MSLALHKDTTVAYSGTDVGRIYLRDIGMRNQLGGGKGIYVLGQDCYINKGDSTVLTTTGDLLMSIQHGVIKSFVTSGSLVVTY